MKQDTVKKCNLCRKYLKLGLHSVQNCYGDPCSKCGGDHHTLICPNPKGEQVYMNNVQLRESLYTDDIYEQNSNCFLTNGIIDDNSQSLDDLDNGYENQMDGYVLQQEDDTGIFFVRDKDSSFDLNDYIMYENDEEIQPCEPHEHMNSFKITVADGTET